MEGPKLCGVEGPKLNGVDGPNLGGLDGPKFGGAVEPNPNGEGDCPAGREEGPGGLPDGVVTCSDPKPKVLGVGVGLPLNWRGALEGPCGALEGPNDIGL